MPGAGFTKSSRVLNGEDFKKSYKTGKRTGSRNFSIHISCNGLNRTRLGLSVSSAAGGAVVRNRLKRLIREFFRLNKGLFPPSSDVVVTIRKKTDIKGYADLEKEFLSALSTAGRR